MYQFDWYEVQIGICYYIYVFVVIEACLDVTLDMCSDVTVDSLRICWHLSEVESRFDVSGIEICIRADVDARDDVIVDSVVTAIDAQVMLQSMHLML